MIPGRNTCGEGFRPRTSMPRRAALKLLGGALALPAANVTATAAERAIWKTAVGLNGFQSGTRKYKNDPSHFDQMNGATGKPEELLARVGPKNIGYVQFCDTDSTRREGGTSTHLGCGDGRIDCAKSLRLLKDGGFRGWIMVDEWEVPDPYDACLKCQQVIDAVGRS